MMHEHAKMIGPLLSRLHATKAGANYPLDPVERELLIYEIERLRADADLALGEATRLLESFVREHCSPVPEWKPLPNLLGVLSQLSNAVTVTRDLRATIADLTEALQDCVDRCYDCGGTGTIYPHDPADVPGSAGIDCPNCSKQRAALARAQGGQT